MNKEFVPHNESLELKELGFDEPCLMYWNDFGKTSINRFQLCNRIDEWCHNYIEAPLYQQAFRWFREKYNLCGVITPQSYEIWGYPDGGCIIEQYPVHTYEEAELECLKKLIELVKNK